MDPAYYVAAGSLKARSFQLEALSNNLANVDTVGYKSERTFYSVFNKSGGQLPLSRYVNEGTVLAQSSVDFQQGAFRTTGRSLDLAIEGNAFFMVQTPQGPRASRDGRLRIGEGGRLESVDGAPVLGKNNQPITLLPRGGEVTVSPDGTVQQDGTVLGQLELKAYRNPGALQRAGNSRFDATGQEEAAPRARVIQGQLETSTADAPSAMIEMIRLNRLFEMSMKVASTLTNDLDAKSISDIAGGR